MTSANLVLIMPVFQFYANTVPVCNLSTFQESACSCYPTQYNSSFQHLPYSKSKTKSLINRKKRLVYKIDKGFIFKPDAILAYAQAIIRSTWQRLSGECDKASVTYGFRIYPRVFVRIEKNGVNIAFISEGMSANIILVLVA